MIELKNKKFNNKVLFSHDASIVFDLIGNNVVVSRASPGN